MKCVTSENDSKRIAMPRKRLFVNPIETTTTTTKSLDRVLITCVPRLLKCGNCPIIKYMPLFAACDAWDCSGLRNVYGGRDRSNIHNREILFKLNITIASRIDCLQYELDVRN